MDSEIQHILLIFVAFAIVAVIILGVYATMGGGIHNMTGDLSNNLSGISAALSG